MESGIGIIRQAVEEMAHRGSRVNVSEKRETICENVVSTARVERHHIPENVESRIKWSARDDKEGSEEIEKGVRNELFDTKGF
jgi:hypothetical protein